MQKDQKTTTGKETGLLHLSLLIQGQRLGLKFSVRYKDEREEE